MSRSVILQLLVLSLCAAASLAQTQQALNLTAVPPNLAYQVNFTIAQLKSEIRYYEVQISDLQRRVAGNVEVLRHNKKLVDLKYLEIDEQFERLAVFSPRTKFCVIQLQGRVPAVQTVQSRLDTCINVANSQGTSVTSSPNSQLNNARNNAENYLRTDVNTCLRNNANSASNLTTCISRRIDERSAQTKLYLSYTDREIDTASCRINSIFKDAQKCVFDVITGAWSDIGNVLKAVEVCVSGWDHPLIQLIRNSNNATLVAT